MVKQTQNFPNDILWGVEEIAAYAKCNRRKAYYLIAKKVLPVTKLGPKTIIGFKSKISHALGWEMDDAR
jgi:hypothetical protein